MENWTLKAREIVKVFFKGAEQLVEKIWEEKSAKK